MGASELLHGKRVGLKNDVRKRRMPGFLGFYAEPMEEETGVWSEDGAGVMKLNSLRLLPK